MATSLFLGSGGAGMKGLAYLLRQTGETVLGFDDNPDTTELSLEEALAATAAADRIVHTDAASEDHPLRKEARKHGIPEVAYQKALGEFSAQYKTIAITGTHGKSSTTSFLAHICIENGLDPNVLVGANMPGLPGGHARAGKGSYFIVEADEYRRHFLELSPNHIIITSIDYDHPDAFSSLEDVIHAYESFMALLPNDGTVTIAEKEHTAHPSIAWPKNLFVVPEQDSIATYAPIPGEHMKRNASLAIHVATLLGISPDKAKESLRTFPGLSRRFELLGTFQTIPVRSDYGHHPSEIAATIAAAKEAYPSRPIIAVFEAHMPLRLHTYFDDFVQALCEADAVIIAPPFIPTGRDSNETYDIPCLQNALEQHQKPAALLDSYESLDGRMQQAISSLAIDPNASPVLIAFSAGKLDSCLRKIVKKS